MPLTNRTVPFLQAQPTAYLTLTCERRRLRIAGAISETDVIVQIWTLLLGGLALAYGLDVWAQHDFPSVLSIAVFGSLISYIYSAPPLKLKQSGWLGNYALGSSYIALPWWAGQVHRLISKNTYRRIHHEMDRLFLES